MEKNRNTILLVEDESSIRDMIKFSLSREFTVIGVESIAKANREISINNPHLILLDWMLPDASGIDFIKSLKKNSLTREIPIIMLTAKAEENNKIMGLETGADDYITKPFSPRELTTRIKTVLRRGSLVMPEELIYFHDLCLNTKTHTATIKDKQLSLTALEYKLLLFFVTNKGRVSSRSTLLDLVWGKTIDAELRTVDVHIRRLRKKLATFGYDKFVKTIHGAGYKFSDIKSYYEKK